MRQDTVSVGGDEAPGRDAGIAAAEEEAGRGVREPVPVGGVGHEGAPRLGDTPEAAE